MSQRDSIDKIITNYFSSVNAEEFTYQGKTYLPKPLRVGPKLFREFTCPANCGACCKNYTLDYLPEPVETHPYPLTLRHINFKGRDVPIWSDLNNDHDDNRCRNLNKENGRCMIHTKHAFSCDFELTRFLNFAAAEAPNHLTTKLYGRGKQMLRVDGERGAKCEMLAADRKSAEDVIRKLKRLRQWCEHFNLKHNLGELIGRLQHHWTCSGKVESFS